METPKRYCITFAGAVGCSKTPIANYLSTYLNLPVFNNDAIRTEVTEDVGHFDVEEYNKRQAQRSRAVLASGISFIYDASVDRKWAEAEKEFKQAGYRLFVISFDLSYGMLLKLYAAKGYTQGDRLPLLIQQHDAFLKQYGDVVGLHITDEQFSDRLSLAKEHVTRWLAAEKLSTE